MGLRFDDSHAPLMVIVARGPLGLEEAKQMCRFSDGLIAAGQKLVFLSDYRDARPELSRKVKNHMTAWTRENRDAIRDQCVGSAIVVNGRLLVTILNAFLKLLRLPTQTQLFAEPEEARKWLVTLLAGAGLPTPETWPDLPR